MVLLVWCSQDSGWHIAVDEEEFYICLRRLDGGDNLTDISSNWKKKKKPTSEEDNKEEEEGEVVEEVDTPASAAGELTELELPINANYVLHPVSRLNTSPHLKDMWYPTH